MKITDIKATTVTVPLEARCGTPPGATGAVRADDRRGGDGRGYTGLGEMGGGGESAEAVFHAMKTYLVGHDPARLEEMRFKIANPTASLYNNRTQILAALEFACLDIIGKGACPFTTSSAASCRTRCPSLPTCSSVTNPKTGDGEVRTSTNRRSR